MGNFHKKRTDEEEEILPIGRRKPRPEPKPERKGFVGRFPLLPDGRPALGFATLSHSKLKTWTKVAAAQGHNTRKIDAPNVRKDAPQPIELLDGVSGSYGDRVKAVLKEHGASTKIRDNVGAIATEDVFGASPEYWNRDGDWKAKPLSEIIGDPVVQAALALAMRTHGKRLISVTLHVDEESPHIHVVAVPLVQREHAVRGRPPKGCPRDEAGKPIDPRPKVLKWTLDVSSQRGRSQQLEKNHDGWAAECAPFGLVRGLKGSEMTEEERRNRRNRQTGRASMAEKVAREDREALGREVQANHADSEVYLERARALRAQAEKDKAAAEVAREDAEKQRETSRFLQRELFNLEFAVKQKKLEAGAALRKALELRKEASARSEELAEQQARLAAQLNYLAKIVDPETETKAVLKDGVLSITGAAADERGILKHLPEQLKVAVMQFLRVAAGVCAQSERIENEHEKIERQKRKLEAEREQCKKATDLAKQFSAAWTAVPECARMPQIDIALAAAEALTVSDFPPGYALPGRSGGASL
jgi:hypothetical protein